MKLYEIDRAIDSLILNSIDEHGEIINPDLESNLIQLNMKLNEKILSIGCFILSLEKTSELHKEQAAKQNLIAARLQKQADFFRSYILNHCHLDSGTKIEDERITVSCRKGQCFVELLVPERDVPGEFRKDEIVIKVDKEGIKKALKEGEDLSYAKLSEGKKYLIIK